MTQGSIEEEIQAGGLEVTILYNKDSHYIHLGLLSCNCMAQFLYLLVLFFSPLSLFAPLRMKTNSGLYVFSKNIFIETGDLFRKFYRKQHN